MSNSTKDKSNQVLREGLSQKRNKSVKFHTFGPYPLPPKNVKPINFFVGDKT